MSRPDDWLRFTIFPDDISSLRTIKEKVAYILNRDPEARNSDKVLWVRYLEQFHGLDPETTPLTVIQSGEYVSESTVRRARAELQNQYELYLPTRPEVVVRRWHRQRAFAQVFSRPDLLEAAALEEAILYSDESGLTDTYMVYAFVCFLSGRDSFEFTRFALRRHVEGGLKYFHFKNFRNSHSEEYQNFFLLGVERPSFRAYVHIFKNSELRGPTVDALRRSYEAAAGRTLRELQGGGLIGDGYSVTWVPDEGQDQAFYSQLENTLEPQFTDRGIHFGGINPSPSNAAYPIQLADLVASSFGRRLNAPGNTAKDELAASVLTHWGIENLLTSASYQNLTVVAH